MGYLVQAGVQLQDLQGAHVSHHQPVLHTGSLRSTAKETSQKEQDASILTVRIKLEWKVSFLLHYTTDTMNTHINKYLNHLPNISHLGKLYKVG